MRCNVEEQVWRILRNLETFDTGEISTKNFNPIVFYKISEIRSGAWNEQNKWGLLVSDQLVDNAGQPLSEKSNSYM